MRKSVAIGVASAALACAGGGVYLFFGYSESLRVRHDAISAIPGRPTGVKSLPAELGRRLDAAERELRSDGDPAQALAALAVLYHANGFEAEAATLYRALLSADPHNPRWPHNLAHLLSGYGRADDAVVLWRHVTEADRAYVPAHIRLGDALLKLDRWDEAEAAYRAGLAIAAGDPYLLNGLGRVEAHRGHYEAARDALEVATEHSQFRIGNSLLVTVYEKLGLKAKADAVRGQAKSFGSFFDPPDPWLDSIYDDCYDAYRLTLGAGMADKRDDRATAIRLLERNVRLHPEYFLAHYQLGSLYEKAGSPDRAEQLFRRTAELDPAFGDAWLGLYRIAKNVRGRPAGLAALREGLAKCPDSPGLHFEYGRYLKEQNRSADARREFELVTRLRPAEVDALIELAQLDFAADRLEEGTATLRRVLDVLPGQPVALTTLTFFSISSGAKADARNWLGQCRAQPRIPREDLERLNTEFQRRFGESPW